MTNVEIVDYSPSDNVGALELEKLCPQGEKTRFRFIRPTFHARTESYLKGRIFCAKQGDQLVGTSALAIKSLVQEGKESQAAYFYDVRINPGHRRSGIAQKLIEHMLHLTQSCDWQYALIAKENYASLNLVQKQGFYPYAEIHALLISVRDSVKSVKLNAVQFEYVVQENKKLNPWLDWRPYQTNFFPVGEVGNFEVAKVPRLKFSLWSLQKYMTEEIIQVPRKLRIAKLLSSPFKGLIDIPYIPCPGDRPNSWILHTMSAQNADDFELLYSSVNWLARQNEVRLITLLLDPRDLLYKAVKRKAFHSFPIVVMAKGKNLRKDSPQIYIEPIDI